MVTRVQKLGVPIRDGYVLAAFERALRDAFDYEGQAEGPCSDWKVEVFQDPDIPRVFAVKIWFLVDVSGAEDSADGDFEEETYEAIAGPLAPRDEYSVAALTFHLERCVFATWPPQQPEDPEHTPTTLNAQYDEC
jgi:hypothetical protein